KPPKAIGFWFGIDPTEANAAHVDYFEVAAVASPVSLGIPFGQSLPGEQFKLDVMLPGATTVNVTGLPEGLTFDPATMSITGVPQTIGAFEATVTGSNRFGSITQTVPIALLWPSSTNSPPANPVSWWRAESNAADFAGMHPGTVGGGLAYSNGWYGKAFAFNGKDASVSLGPWFNLPQFTIAMWVKPGHVQPQYADIIDNNHDTGRSWVIQHLNQSTDLTTKWTWTVLGREAINFDLYSEVWQHLAITRDAGNVSRLYINGALAATNAGNGPVSYTGSQNFYLGRHHSLGRYFNGQLDEVMVFNRALDPAELALVCGRVGTLTPPSAPVARLQGEVSTPGHLTLSWEGASRHTYQVQCCTHPGSSPWIDLGSPIIGSTGWMSLPIHAGESQLFYRLIAR
ncbi:hypothetical protein EG834_11535, partial [bacterium]|nr:hypothetical protein [bacterium]